MKNILGTIYKRFNVVACHGVIWKLNVGGCFEVPTKKRVSMPYNVANHGDVIAQATFALPFSTFYMRSLPPLSIPLRSDEGNRLFDEARAAGTAMGTLTIMSTFKTQKELTYCGLSSLTVVLNALSIDPQLQWKGPWRWYEETMLVDEETLRKVNLEGISFEQLVNAVPTDKVKLQAFFANESSFLEFKNYLSQVTATDTSFIIVCYSRSVLQQTGDGHFSPIAAYNAANDLVLILDVARYKYPPHWVTCSILWEAMSAIDKTTGKCRGFMVVSKA